MSQIATNRAQSMRLVRVGLICSADMFELVDKDGNSHYRQIIGPVSVSEMQEQGFKVVNTAAWSLSALWQMFHELDKTYEFPTDLSADELIETLVRTIIFRRENQ